ncbi:DNA polymerase I, partial [Micrococcus sp. HG099]|uniref:5'-3' exonuclease H3TH domain-containing protein n=1 Tax=Micrococcus sp. HG099 TaxID=2969755 RepID=UPI0028116540
MAADPTPEDPQRLLVLDGHSMAFRAFYALPAENFATDTGQHTNAVYGFTAMLLTMIRQQRPTHVAVAFDLSGPTFRSEEYGEYKAGRSETPAEFAGQIELTVKVMEALGIPTITLEGYEADDIVATLSARAEEAGWEAVVVSGDRDAFQLISERTTVLYPKKGVSDIPPMDADAVMAKYGVSPAQYPELAALVGEAADNLPGVPGVGPGFAAKWLTQYGDLDGVLAHADEIKGKKGEALRAHLDDVRRNRRLNALVRDLDLPIGLEAMALEMPEREPVEELFDALQFNRIRERVFEVFSERLGETAPAAQVEEAPEFTEAATAQDVADFLAAEAGNLLGVHVDVEGPALLPKRKVPVPGTFGTAVGVALVGEHAGLHVSLDADAPDPALLAALREALGEGGLSKAVHDLKRVLKAIAEPAEATALEAGTPLDGVVDDVLLSAYLIQPDRRDTSLEALAEAHLHTPLAAPREPAEADAQGA